MNLQPDSGCGILITEDHQPTANLLRSLLAAAFPDQHVSTAFSAEEALESCRTTLPRVVIMDISLPGMNGIDATRHIKTSTPSVNVVIHSNLDADIYSDACMAAGASAYVLKARPQSRLIPVVAQLLSTTSA